MFVDRHKLLNIIENCKIFLNKIEKLRLYLVEFDKNSIIKEKKDLLNYIVNDKNC